MICDRWILHLDKAFKASGLEVVESKRHSAQKDMLAHYMDLTLQTLNEFSYGVDRTIGTDAGNELRKKVNNAYVEYRLHSTVIEGDLMVCVGRKPEVSELEINILLYSPKFLVK